VYFLREADLEAFERRREDELRGREIGRIRAAAAEAGQRSLDEFAQAGIGFVEVLATEDACSACKRWTDTTLRLADVPPLPIPGCLNDYCRCDYLPVID
jgi:hypothetical protein